MTMTAEEIKTLGDSEMETGRSVAIALGIVSIAFLLIIGAFSFAVVPNLLPVVALLVVSLGAAAVTGAMFWAWRRRNQIIALFMRYK
jgi:CHASE2 domain-containing sensor protein